MLCSQKLSLIFNMILSDQWQEHQETLLNVIFGSPKFIYLKTGIHLDAFPGRDLVTLLEKYWKDLLTLLELLLLMVLWAQCQCHAFIIKNMGYRISVDLPRISLQHSWLPPLRVFSRAELSSSCEIHGCIKWEKVVLPSGLCSQEV